MFGIGSGRFFLHRTFSLKFLSLVMLMGILNVSAVFPIAFSFVWFFDLVSGAFFMIYGLIKWPIVFSYVSLWGVNFALMFFISKFFPLHFRRVDVSSGILHLFTAATTAFPMNSTLFATLLIFGMLLQVPREWRLKNYVCSFEAGKPTYIKPPSLDCCFDGDSPRDWIVCGNQIVDDRDSFKFLAFMVFSSGILSFLMMGQDRILYQYASIAIVLLTTVFLKKILVKFEFWWKSDSVTPVSDKSFFDMIDNDAIFCSKQERDLKYGIYRAYGRSIIGHVVNKFVASYGPSGLLTAHHGSEGSPLQFRGEWHDPVSINRDFLSYLAPGVTEEATGDEIDLLVCSLDDKVVRLRCPILHCKSNFLFVYARGIVSGMSGSPALCVETGKVVGVLTGIYGLSNGDQMALVSTNVEGGERNIYEMSSCPDVFKNFNINNAGCGSGKTRRFLAGKAEDHHRRGETFLMLAPTRVVAREMYDAMSAFCSLTIKGADAAERAKTGRFGVITTHGYFAQMSLSRVGFWKQRFVYVDEAHFDLPETVVALKLLAVSPNHETTICTATWNDQVNRATNYPIETIDLDEDWRDDIVSRIVSLGGKGIAFLPSFEGRYGIRKLAHEISSKGIRVVALSRATFNENYQRARDLKEGVILSTNISECGANFFVDWVITTGVRNVPILTGVESKLVEKPIGRASETQQRGRVGRSKPGTWIRYNTDVYPMPVDSHEYLWVEVALHLWKNQQALRHRVRNDEPEWDYLCGSLGITELSADAWMNGSVSTLRAAHGCVSDEAETDLAGQAFIDGVRDGVRRGDDFSGLQLVSTHLQENIFEKLFLGFGTALPVFMRDIIMDHFLFPYEWVAREHPEWMSFAFTATWVVCSVVFVSILIVYFFKRNGYDFKYRYSNCPVYSYVKTEEGSGVLELLIIVLWCAGCLWFVATRLDPGISRDLCIVSLCVAPVLLYIMRQLGKPKDAGLVAYSFVTILIYSLAVIVLLCCIAAFAFPKSVEKVADHLTDTIGPPRPVVDFGRRLGIKIDIFCALSTYLLVFGLLTSSKIINAILEVAADRRGIKFNACDGPTWTMDAFTGLVGVTGHLVHMDWSRVDEVMSMMLGLMFGSITGLSCASDLKSVVKIFSATSDAKGATDHLSWIGMFRRNPSKPGSVFPVLSAIVYFLNSFWTGIPWAHVFVLLLYLLCRVRLPRCSFATPTGYMVVLAGLNSNLWGVMAFSVMYAYSGAPLHLVSDVASGLSGVVDRSCYNSGLAWKRKLNSLSKSQFDSYRSRGVVEVMVKGAAVSRGYYKLRDILPVLPRGVERIGDLGAGRGGFTQYLAGFSQVRHIRAVSYGSRKAGHETWRLDSSNTRGIEKVTFSEGDAFEEDWRDCDMLVCDIGESYADPVKESTIDYDKLRLFETVLGTRPGIIKCMQPYHPDVETLFGPKLTGWKRSKLSRNSTTEMYAFLNWPLHESFVDVWSVLRLLHARFRRDEGFKRLGDSVLLHSVWSDPFQRSEETFSQLPLLPSTINLEGYGRPEISYRHWQNLGTRQGADWGSDSQCINRVVYAIVEPLLRCYGKNNPANYWKLTDTKPIKTFMVFKNKVDFTPSATSQGLRLLEEAYDFFGSMLWQDGFRLEPLSYDEAVRVCNHRGAIGGSGFWKDLGEATRDPGFRHMVEMALYDLGRLEAPGAVFNTMGKREKKNMQGRQEVVGSRLISYLPAHWRMVELMVFGKLATLSWEDLPGLVSHLAPYDYGNLIRRYSRDFSNPRYIADDVAGWDTKISVGILSLESDFLKSLTCSTWQRRRISALYRIYANPVIKLVRPGLNGGLVEDLLLGRGQRMSGTYVTYFMNSITNLCVQYSRVCYEMNVSMEYAFQISRAVCSGDDCVLIGEPAVIEKVAAGRFMDDHLGMPRKDISYEQNSYVWHDIDFSFCSHTYVDLDFYDGSTRLVPARPVPDILGRLPLVTGCFAGSSSDGRFYDSERAHAACLGNYLLTNFAWQRDLRIVGFALRSMCPANWVLVDKERKPQTLLRPWVTPGNILDIFNNCYIQNSIEPWDRPLTNFHDLPYFKHARERCLGSLLHTPERKEAVFKIYERVCKMSTPDCVNWLRLMKKFENITDPGPCDPQGVGVCSFEPVQELN